MSNHPRVTVRLNSGNYQGIVNGKVASRDGKEFGRKYEVELLDHPKLKRVNVDRNQFEINDDQPQEQD